MQTASLAHLLDRLIGDSSIAVSGLLAIGIGLALVALLSMARGRSDVRRRAAAGVETGSVRPPAGASPQQSFNRLIGALEANLAKANANETKLLRKQLMQAGFFDPRAVGLYFAARIGGLVLLGAGGFLVLPQVLDKGANAGLYAAGLGLLGYFLPSFYVKRRISVRVDQHRMGFPDFMDLMVVCAEAGLSLEAGIERVARELVDGYPSLAENLYMVSLELRAGKAFGEALERLGTRLGIEEATMLATLLQQSSELGTSLSQSLRVYSEEMRHKRLSRAEEKAYSLPAKLVVPLILFVFPVLIMTLMLPVVVRMSGAGFGG